MIENLEQWFVEMSKVTHQRQMYPLNHALFKIYKGKGVYNIIEVIRIKLVTKDDGGYWARHGRIQVLEHLEYIAPEYV